MPLPFDISLRSELHGFPVEILGEITPMEDFNGGHRSRQTIPRHAPGPDVGQIKLVEKVYPPRDLSGDPKFMAVLPPYAEITLVADPVTSEKLGKFPDGGNSFDKSE
jgi:hypothetical protein